MKRHSTALAALAAFLVLLIVAFIPTAATSHGPSPAAPDAAAAIPGAWDIAWRSQGEIFDLQCFGGGVCFAAGNAGMFLRSEDGGHTWGYQALSPAVDLLALSFATNSRGLVVGDQGRVFRTNDGGLTWQSSTAPGVTSLRTVSFLADGRAWAAAAGGVILFSSDSGVTWSAQTSGVTKTLRAIDFLDANTGYAAGDDGIVLKTTNGGAVWTKLATPYPSWAPIYTLFFTTTQQGWLAGQTGDIYRTSDGGATWQVTDADFGNIYDIHFVGDAGVLGAANGAIATSTDSGAAWVSRSATSFNKNDTRAVFALAPNDLWAAGALKSDPDNGQRVWWIRHSSDGVTFARSAGGFSLTPHLHDVAMPSSDVAYVVGEGWSIGKTTDGGQSWAWQAIDIPESGFFQSLSCADNDHCIAGGRFGLMYITADGGQTWQRKTIAGVGRPIWELNMLDAKRGLLGTNFSDDDTRTTFYTVDGGQNWIASNAEGRNIALEFSMVNDKAGWAALRNFSYRVTTDGGKNWKRITSDSLSKGIFEAIQAQDDDQNGAVDKVWLAGCVGPLVNAECPTPRTGIIAHTQNAGGEWAYQTLPANTPPLTTIEMLDAGHGWAAGEQGVILYTDSGGAAWERVASPDIAGARISNMAFVASGRGVGVSDMGYILRFTGPGHTLRSYQQSIAITVDGQASDWHQGGDLILDSTAANTVLGDPPFPSAADASIQTFSRWTNDTLYLLFEVHDDSLQPEDAVRLALDGLDDNQWGGADDHQLRANPSGDLSDDLHPDQASQFQFQVGTMPGGWLAELGIPAALLGRGALNSSASVGFNLALDDDDSGGGAHTLILEGRRLDINPANFGAIRPTGNAVQYQDGSNGYAGTTDTFLERWSDSSGNTAHGNDANLNLIFSQGALYADTLVRFELDGLPTGALSTKAELDLYTEAKPNITAALTITAYRLLKPWNEKLATWNRPDANQTWGGGGAAKPGVDYDPTPLSSVVAPAGQNGRFHMKWDITPALNVWLANPSSNYGILLIPSGGQRSIPPVSSEYATPAVRPKLEVSFSLQPRSSAPTPTLTSTPSPTPTPSSMPTSTPTPTPSLTPTPTSSPTSSPTPTPTPTSTATSTPSSTPTTTPSPTLSPTATPTPTTAPLILNLYLPLLRK